MNTQKPNERVGKIVQQTSLGVDRLNQTINEIVDIMDEQHEELLRLKNLVDPHAWTQEKLNGGSQYYCGR